MILRHGAEGYRQAALISPSSGVESLREMLLELPTSFPGRRPLRLRRTALAAALLPLVGCLGEPGRIRAERETRGIESEPWTDPGKVVAEVNGQPITRGDYYQRILKKFGTRTMLGGIIKDELFAQEARRRGITVSREEVDARVTEMIAAEAARAGGHSELAAIYRREDLTLEDLRRDYARDVESHLMAGKVTRALRVTDEAALRDYYQKTYARTRYHVRHIPYAYPLRGYSAEETSRLKALAREKAARTAHRVREGADFGEIARQESEDATRQSGGDIGYVSEDMEMDAAMKEAVFKLKPGEVSDPVENNLYGAYHVVQVTEVIPHMSFSDCEARMKAELRDREPDLDEIRTALNVLRDGAAIKIFGVDRDPSPPEPGAGGR